SLLRREQVVAALAELAPEQRQVLELAYFGGLTHRQIAEATKTALGTVHTRARLGLQKLRSALLAKGYEFD
ncbi:MAG: sigma factor-like helix-turn-helix DNA-binding protein, partial [Terriglobales bacterium]